MTARAVLVALVATLPWCVGHSARGERGAPEDAQGPARFTARADLVVLHVSVMDRSGLVSGLPREAFTVFEDGRPQRIAFFLNVQTPATVGLVIDASTSMHRKREAVVAAAMAFSKSTHPRDEIFTVHFNERVWFGLPPDEPFTSDPSRLRAALERAPARGRTALFDAVAAGLERATRGSSARRALIVISDGGDNASRASLADALAAADRADVLIYTLCLADEYDGDADPGTLERLAEASGAIAFSPRAVRDAPQILERIARDIHGGYTIGYVPESRDAGRGAVRVEVSAAGRGRIVVRTRSSHGPS